MTSTLDHIEHVAPQQPASTVPDDTQVKALARYTTRATFEDLSSESRRQLPSTSLIVLPAPSQPWVRGSNVCRDQVGEFGGQGIDLIGGGSANPVYAAFWHTVLVRYVDFMDNFLAPTETCHTADNSGWR